MNESFETTPTYFKWPNIEKEEGEFERVAGTFGVDSSVLMFLAGEGELVDLDSDVWSELENTDSNSVEVGDWDAVHDHSNPDGQHKRDWESLKKKMDSGTEMDSPIIMKIGNKYHLVSGNTRLMVSPAKGVIPKVLLFEVDENKESD